MICPRCNNKDPKYFYTFNGHTYCRKCIQFGQSGALTTLKTPQNNNIQFHLSYKLTPLQQEMSNWLCYRYQAHQNTILKAVCGAGKTEITFAVIRYALNQGHTVCFTTPRKELTIELAQRFKQHFSNIEITLLYGGHTKKTVGQFIICTTHQLFRYQKYFDLLILDELDAFPYANNTVLKNILHNSIRGNYIFMSATVSKQPDLKMKHRYHGYPLDIPKCHITNQIIMYLWTVILIKNFKKLHQPVLVYVPSVALTKKVQNFLAYFKIKCHAVSSKTEQITTLINNLTTGQLDALITTTILERGITIANVQVIVLYGENQIFDEATLIQICGRVGRKKEYPTGSINIFAFRKTSAIKQCIQTIETDNA